MTRFDIMLGIKPEISNTKFGLKIKVAGSFFVNFQASETLLLTEVQKN